MGTISPASCLIDTNILIYYINKQPDATMKQFVDECIAAGSAVSIISRIEVLGWRGHDEDSLHKTKALLGRLQESALTDTIARQCIELRRSYSAINYRMH